MGLEIGQDVVTLGFLKKIFYLLISDCAGSSLLHRLSQVAANWGYSLVAVHGLLIVLASLVVEHGLQSAYGSVAATLGL